VFDVFISLLKMISSEDRNRQYKEAQERFNQMLKNYKPNEAELRAKEKGNFYSLVGWTVGGLGAAVWAQRKCTLTYQLT
jgi:hypothetical protein